MFSLKDVRKIFSDKLILDKVSFNFSGNKMLFVGLNGVGKTTTLNLILGLDKNYDGSISRSWKHASVQFSDNTLPNFLTFNEFCMSRDVDKKRFVNLVKLLNVEKYLDKQIKNLSLGTIRKFNLLFALVSNGDLVFLDEPTNGLDYQCTYNLLNYINSDDRKYFIISHNLNLINEVCDHLVILHDKKIIFDEKFEKDNLDSDASIILDEIIKGGNDENIDD